MIWFSPAVLAQADFGGTMTELRELSGIEIVKPPLDSDTVGNPDQVNPNDPDKPPGDLQPVNRPLYLVMRYYSCVPWLRSHVKDVYNDVIPRTSFQVSYDVAGYDGTAQTSPAGQLVTDVRHPAYGLYCIRIIICVPYDQWPANAWRRIYVRWAHSAPYWCWLDHWWYYWRRPCVEFPLTPQQEVQQPAVVSQASGKGRVCHDENGNVIVTVSYANLNANTASGGPSGLTAAHIHGPAAAGANAGILLDLTPTTGATSGTINKTALAGATLVNAISTGNAYVNLHSNAYSGGELRGQIPALPTGARRWCPYRPTWIPCVRWTRSMDIWGLTICHPYCYRWVNTFYRRPFCLYGLQYYFAPLPNQRPTIAQGDATNAEALPLQNRLNETSLSGKAWTNYNSVALNVPQGYWPFSPYCSRWYWFRCTPFSLYRWHPPICRFAIWVDDDPSQVDVYDPPGFEGEFPTQPGKQIPGTVVNYYTRAQSVLPGDLNSDGRVNIADLQNYRAQTQLQTIDSFFDVFTELE